MLTLKRSLLSLLSLLLLLSTVIAQEEKSTNPTKDAFLVTASVTDERLRFTAPSSVVQLRLEVYNSTGNKIFDNEVRGGNVLDWPLRDAQAQPLADDAYLCVLTLKSLSGKLSQSFGSLKVERNSAALQPVDPAQMATQQAQAILPVAENIALTVLQKDEPQTTTVVAHNGEDGLLTRGHGALSFRLGDFFSGKDSEQMRLTAEGNLGIGITAPQARLDVAGLIRTSEGILFPDGSVQKTAAGTGAQGYGKADKVKGAGSADAASAPEQTVTGSGTTNFIPKWTGATTLGDSAIVEVGGNVGIGTAAPVVKLHLAAPTAYALLFQTSDSNSANFAVLNTTSGHQYNLGVTGSAHGYGPGRFFIYHQNSASNRFIIDTAGNVGIGTIAPVYRLHIGVADQGLRVEGPNGAGTAASFGGNGDFSIDAPGVVGGRFVVKHGGNVGIGTNDPAAKLHVSGSGVIRARVNSDDNAGVALTLGDQPKWSVATVTGGQFQIFNDAIGQNAVWIDSASNNVGIGTNAPADKLTVSGGAIRYVTPPGGGGPNLCWNASMQISFCSSSQRYKTNIAPLHAGLNLINRLRPVTFDWVQNSEPDLGLVAEEVAEVEPRLVSRNPTGQIEGVRYDRIGIVLVNAIKELKAENDSLREQNAQLDARLKALEQKLNPASDQQHRAQAARNGSNR